VSSILTGSSVNGTMAARVGIASETSRMDTVKPLLRALCSFAARQRRYATLNRQCPDATMMLPWYLQSAVITCAQHQLLTCQPF
jgi:hypothetical protein